MPSQTSPFVFVDAVKSQERLRLALDGITGGGKTWTALTIGCYLAEREGGVPAVIDSERSSAKKYASYFKFKHLTLPDFDPHTYIGAIEAAIAEGFPVIIVDSFSHAWEGTLDMKDRVQRRSTSNDGYGAWREVTPVHNRLVDLVLRAPAHIIVTMRSKMEYIVDTTPDGKKITGVRKVGLKPVQRDGVEYEFDIVGDLDQENTLTITKSRCHALAGSVVQKPGANFAKTIAEWLDEGEPAIESADAARIIEAFEAVPEVDGRRLTAKRDFVARWGRPEQLLASQAATALAWVQKLADEVGFTLPPATPSDPTQAPAVADPSATTISMSTPEGGSEADTSIDEDAYAVIIESVKALSVVDVTRQLAERGLDQSGNADTKRARLAKAMCEAHASAGSAEPPRDPRNETDEPQTDLAKASAIVEPLSDEEVVVQLTERELSTAGNKTARRFRLVQHYAHEYANGSSPVPVEPSAASEPVEGTSGADEASVAQEAS